MYTLTPQMQQHAIMTNAFQMHKCNSLLRLVQRARQVLQGDRMVTVRNSMFLIPFICLKHHHIMQWSSTRSLSCHEMISALLIVIMLGNVLAHQKPIITYFYILSLIKKSNHKPQKHHYHHQKDLHFSFLMILISVYT